MAFKEGVVLGTVSLNATGAGTTNIGGTSNTGTIAIGNAASGTVSVESGTINIGNNATASAISIGSVAFNKTIDIGFGAANMGIRIGVANGTSSVDIESGSGGVIVNSVGGTATIGGSTGATIDSAGGPIGVGSGNTDNAINIGTLATAGRVITIGNVTGTSNLTLKSGSGNIIANSGLTIDSSGRTTNSVQPAFLAYLASNDTNKTGTGTLFTIGSGTALTKVFDLGTNFNTNGTFTAPVTGHYQFNGAVLVDNCTVSTAIVFQLVTTAHTFEYDFTKGAASGTTLNANISTICAMTAGDTAKLEVATFGEAADTNDIIGSATLFTYFSGFLVC